jgi:hypothetical protein
VIRLESVVPLGYFALQGLCVSIVIKASWDEGLIGLNANTLVFM